MLSIHQSVQKYRRRQILHKINDTSTIHCPSRTIEECIMDGYSMDWIDRITTEHVASYISDELYDAADEYMEIDYGHEDEVNEGIDSEYGVEDLEYNLDIMDYEDENLVQDPRLSRRLSIIAESTASSENTALATNTESSSSNEGEIRNYSRLEC